MKTRIVILTVLAIILWVVFFCEILKIEYQGYEQTLKSKIGKTVVIGKDTLTVTDYSVVQNCLILSNVITINEQLVK